MALHRPNPPPNRNGVGASCVVLPAGPWTLLIDFLPQRFPGVSTDTWLQRLHAGDVIDDQGRVLGPDAPYCAGLRLYYFRALATEPHIPFDALRQIPAGDGADPPEERVGARGAVPHPPH